MKGPAIVTVLSVTVATPVTDGNVLWWIVKGNGDATVHSKQRVDCRFDANERYRLPDSVGKCLASVCPSDCQFKCAGCEGACNCDCIISDCSNACTHRNIIWWVVKSQGDAIVHSKFRTACWIHTHERHRWLDSFAKVARDKDQVKDIDITITVDIWSSGA